MSIAEQKRGRRMKAAMRAPGPSPRLTSPTEESVMLRERTLTLQPVDDHRYRRSLQELRLFRREYPNAIITPGHDASFYDQLEARYE